jgi:hypothetical protein
MQPQTSPMSSSITIPGPKILLMGDSGTGKSHAIRTLIPLGITPFVIATEQNAIQVLKDLPPESWHYKYIAPTPAHGWDQLIDMAKKVNQLSYENLTKVTDPYKTQHNRFLDVITTCNDFVADDDGKSYGSVSSWGTDRALIIDGLSGLSDMAMALVVGNKPVKSMPDWGVAQTSLRMLLNPLTTNLTCPFVLIAHLDREKDEITGGTTVTIKTLGRALAPDIPRMFSDVIRARRLVANFSWDTADSQSTVVARHLKIAQDLPPDFRPLFEAWKARGGVISPPVGSTSK